jgi:hypothetical protein
MQLHQNSNDFIHRNRKLNPKMHMEAQKIPNSQRNTDHNEVLQYLSSNYTTEL